MFSEIGSNFWLNPNIHLKEMSLGSPEQFNCKGSDFVWLSTGRSAIQFVLSTIEKRDNRLKKVAVLPSFTCNTVFVPFLDSGYDVYYYPIERDLTTTANAILETIDKYDASIVLFHRYFGLDTLDGQVNQMCKELRALGKYSIEDSTQCLYSNIPRADADFIVGSIRKWTGTPDGGFAVCNEGLFTNKPQYSDKILEEAKVKASYTKYRYLFEHKGEKSEMLALYRAAESLLDNQEQIYCISDTSAIVQANLNKSELINKRRENFGLLSTLLKEFVTSDFLLGNNEVPLYFPIFVEDRTELQNYLARNDIYAPIVWPKDNRQPRQCKWAENAYEHLLCIPIDQRYGIDDMERIGKVVLSYYRQ